MRRLFPKAADYVPHALHSLERPWPETNCYIDLWIEVLHALGLDPMPLLGLAVAMDWEADHFTFLKPGAFDILALTGITLHELALWDDTETQIVSQVNRGAVALLEVDAFFLPDTGGSAYQLKHTKTTIGIVSVDHDRSSIEYFHNAGLFRLEGEDYDGILGRNSHRSLLFPYAELARTTGEAPSATESQRLARDMIVRLSKTRSGDNPITRFTDALPRLLDRVGSDPDRINALCFNTMRQLGGAFGLLSDHLAWLGEDGTAAALLAEQAKSMQFQIARSARRGRQDQAIATGLTTIAMTWDRCMSSINDFSNVNPATGHDCRTTTPPTLFLRRPTTTSPVLS